MTVGNGLRYYAAPVPEFLRHGAKEVVGAQTIALEVLGFDQVSGEQIRAWRHEVELLSSAFRHLGDRIAQAGLVLEYPIPRRGKRIDAVLVLHDLLIVMEFKVGSTTAAVADRVQVEDYCLDLRDFHQASRGRRLLPVLIPTESRPLPPPVALTPTDSVYPVITVNGAQLADAIARGLEFSSAGGVGDAEEWARGEYRPTPTIIEAACHLYANMDVAEIARSHAGSENLQETTGAILSAVADAERDGKKVICFVTGVPGAGKTLAGLNIVHNAQIHAQGDLGVFLSGNGPLVRVLREALAQDLNRRHRVPLNEARRRTSTFVVNVHRFMDAHSMNSNAPPDRVVIFDEAQRAWNAEQSWRKFKRKASEPEMMMEIMDRHHGWAVLVALVGGGQEIHTGEAGLPEWGRVLQQRFPHWRVVISEELVTGSHATGGKPLFETIPPAIHIETDKSLHLNVSLRSFRADRLSEWVALVLDGNAGAAKQLATSALQDYPLLLTRDLEQAREWLRQHRRGLRRAGLLASSGARRLRPYGIDVTLDLDVEKWFLSPAEDVRSSSFAELAATEFGVQGLELDWATLCWGGDLRWSSGRWGFWQFRGTAWNQVNSPETRQYILNKYRVLLTRAREGLVIWVPQGSEIDDTRLPKIYNPTAEYLQFCGIRLL